MFPFSLSNESPRSCRTQTQKRLNVLLPFPSESMMCVSPGPPPYRVPVICYSAECVAACVYADNSPFPCIGTASAPAR